MTTRQLAETIGYRLDQVSKIVTTLTQKGLINSDLRVRNTFYIRVINPTEVMNDKLGKRVAKAVRSTEDCMEALKKLEHKPLMIPEEILPEIDKLVNAGFSYARIAKALGVGETTINKAHQRKGSYARFAVPDRLSA